MPKSSATGLGCFSGGATDGSSTDSISSIIRVELRVSREFDHFDSQIVGLVGLGTTESRRPIEMTELFIGASS